MRQVSYFFGSPLPQNLNDVNDYLLLIISGAALLALILAAVLLIEFRRMKREKERCILQHLREQDRIEKELERVRIEKETLERVLEVIGHETMNGEQF